MRIINFSHPLTVNQKLELAKWLQVDEFKVTEVAVQFRIRDAFEGQVAEMLDQANVSQGDVDLGVVVMLPALSAAAAVLVAEWHGRFGHFPTVVRLKSVGDLLPEWKLAEVMPLQKIRSRARFRRDK